MGFREDCDTQYDQVVPRIMFLSLSLSLSLLLHSQRGGTPPPARVRALVLVLCTVWLKDEAGVLHHGPPTLAPCTLVTPGLVPARALTWPVHPFAAYCRVCNSDSTGYPPPAKNTAHTTCTLHELNYSTGLLWGFALCPQLSLSLSLSLALSLSRSLSAPPCALHDAT